MSGKHRVYMVIPTTSDPRGPVIQAETKEMPQAEADKVAAEASALGIPVVVRPA